jgi:hypothetical protein
MMMIIIIITTTTTTHVYNNTSVTFRVAKADKHDKPLGYAVPKRTSMEFLRQV